MNGPSMPPWSMFISGCVVYLSNSCRKDAVFIGFSDLYSVMLSDGNSFCGDVVSVNFNKTFWDKYHILDQIYESKYVRIITLMTLILL